MVFLLGHKNLASASISMRMSWAAKRRTSRVEDRSYSLLGLFDINIPLIYGEGEKAFRRLQEEIIRAEPYEHTIYAWGKFPTWDAGSIPSNYNDVENIGINTRRLPLSSNVEWDEELANQPFLGLLARSPADFVNCGRFVPSDEAQNLITTSHRVFEPPVFLHGGVRFRPRLLNIGSNQVAHHLRHPQIIQLRRASYIALFVRDSSEPVPHEVIIPVIMWNKTNWGRRFECLIRKGPSKILSEGSDLFVAPEEQRSTLPHDLLPGDIVFRWGLRDSMYRATDHKYPPFDTDDDRWEWLDGEQAIVQRFRRTSSYGSRETGRVASWAFKMVDSRQYWSIVVHRLSHEGRQDIGALAFSIVRTQAQGKKMARRMGGHIWYPQLVLRLPSFQDLADIAACRHMVERSTDIWRPEADGLPAGIVLCVETMWDATLREFFEVIDFRFPDGEGDSHFKIPRAD